MIKKLTKMLLRDNDYTLETYTILQPTIKRSKIIKPFLILFAVLTVLFALDVSGTLVIGFNFILYFLSFLLFVAYPLSTINDYAKEVLIVTPELFIQRVSGKDFKTIVIDEINKFNFDEESIQLTSGETLLELGLKKYEHHIAIIIEVLESKGKTFDKEKDFMVRPVIIVCDGETVTVKDQKVKATNTEKITYKLASKYSVVTPGFLDQVLPRNSIIYKAYIENKDLYLELNQLEINGEHPENTTFGPIKVINCVMIFENIELHSMAKRQENTRAFKYKELTPSLELLLEEIKTGVISEWRFKKTNADIIYAVGIGSVKTNMSYTGVIVAWEKQK